MEHRAGSFPLRVVALDVVLALFITVMQAQGTLARVAAEGAPRPLTDFGNLGLALLVVSGLVVAVRRLWPVPRYSSPPRSRAWCITASTSRTGPDGSGSSSRCTPSLPTVTGAGHW